MRIKGIIIRIIIALLLLVGAFTASSSISRTDKSENSGWEAEFHHSTDQVDSGSGRDTDKVAGAVLIDSGEETSQETRALWERIGVRNQPTSRADIDVLVEKIDTARLNVVLFDVYRHGTAYFEPSHKRFEDKERLPNRSQFEDTEYSDALRYLVAIRDARKKDNDPANDFEVHAWFHIHNGGLMENGWPPIDKTEPYMLNAMFPEFKLKFGAYYQKEDDRFINHQVSVVHQPKFRHYITDLVVGVLEDYKLDGIHLDHIRTGGICFNNENLDYPGTMYDYPGCQEDYKVWTSEIYGQEYTLWDDTDGYKEIKDEARGRIAAWQKNAVATLVKGIHDEIEKIDPNAVISVASVRNDTSQTSMEQLVDGQAAWEWLDQGWIDAIFVTAYTSDTQWAVDKTQSIRDAVQDEGNRSRVFPGLGTYNLDNPDEFWSYLIVEQVNAVMYGQWPGGQPLDPPAKGLALFQSLRLSEQAVRALGEGPFKNYALPYWKTGVNSEK